MYFPEAFFQHAWEFHWSSLLRERLAFTSLLNDWHSQQGSKQCWRMERKAWMLRLVIPTLYLWCLRQYLRRMGRYRHQIFDIGYTKWIPVRSIDAFDTGTWPVHALSPKIAVVCSGPCVIEQGGVVQSSIKVTFFQFCSFLVRCSVYIFCPSVLSCSHLKISTKQ